MIIQERLAALRGKMKEAGIDIYIVPTADFHQSEYVGEHFKARKFITNFSGSVGTAVVTMDEARLWVDGRYFIQAENQLKDTSVELMRIGEPGVPTIEEYLKNTVKAGQTIGFDGRVVSVGEGETYAGIAASRKASVKYSEDLVDAIWEDRPPLSEKPAFALGVEWVGETVASKLERIRKEMAADGADIHIMTTLDDICWTLNLRGDDIDFFPLLLSYCVIKMDSVDFYVNEAKLSDEIKADLAKDGIVLHPYNDIYEDVKSLPAGSTVLIDPDRLNYALYYNLPENVAKVEARNPAILMKALKNPVEIANIRKAQIKDSIAHLRFMKWVKENVGKITITELSASDKLDEFRAEMGNFIRPSFEPISSFAEHSAMCHYTSSEETDVELHEGTFFLTDTGAGFWEGSTDITRTYALGEVTDKMKEHFTLVAISNLQLANANFLEGSTGVTLDILSRKPFWDRNLNFNHGTGHGVGYLLNIHEGPTGFRWTSRGYESEPVHANLIITDEPGLYFEGEYGIRLENELLCVAGEKNEYGQFLHFEPITFVPFDLDAIDPSVMTAEDKELFNAYHKQVYDVIAPYLEDPEELEYLKKYTRAI